jgi:hypothetical protein
MSTGLVLIITFLIITLIILTTIALDFYKKREECYDYPNIYCYIDWECPNGVTGDINNPKFPAQQTFNQVQTCASPQCVSGQQCTGTNGVSCVECGDPWNKTGSTPGTATPVGCCTAGGIGCTT